MDAADPTSRWDSLIQWVVATRWPFVHWKLVKAQVRAESAYDARVSSSAGAVGLLQLMPATFEEIRPTQYAGRPREDPEANLVAGVLYLRNQFTHFPEVSDQVERLKFALASYNCGRGYVNAAIRVWREKNPGQPAAGVSLSWDLVRPQLAHAIVAGHRPRFTETWAYVDRIFTFFAELTAPRYTWTPTSWRPSPIRLPR